MATATVTGRGAITVSEFECFPDMVEAGGFGVGRGGLGGVEGV